MRTTLALLAVTAGLHAAEVAVSGTRFLREGQPFEFAGVRFFNCTPNFGGPRQPTFSHDHIVQILNVWRVGGYVVYHHDMFQTGYGKPAVPPSGIPGLKFSPYHRQVFEFLKLRERYQPTRTP